MTKDRQNKGFQATAHKLSLCDRLRTLQSYTVLPVGRRLNPDVGRKYMKKYLAIILMIAAHIITASAQDEITPSTPTQSSLSRLQAGMSSTQVEAIMGAPLKYYNAGIAGGDTNFMVASYTCIITNVPYPGNHLMTVHYRITETGLRMTEVKGPHFPDEK